MRIEIPNENSIIKWKNDDKDEWKVAEISDLIKAYERPQGEWIVDEDNVFQNYMKCSICNEGAEWLDGGSQFLSNFCSNCGAKMVKGGAE